MGSENLLDDLSACRETLVRLSWDIEHATLGYHRDAAQIREIIERAVEAIVEAIVVARWGR